MRDKKAAIKTLALLVSLAALWPATAPAAPAPAWKLSAIPMPTNLAPGGTQQYFLIATNVGSEPTTGTITLEATLPAPLAPTAAGGRDNDPAAPTPSCVLAAPQVTCTIAEPLHPGFYVGTTVNLGVPAGTPAGEVIVQGKVQGGGGAEVTKATPIQISADPPPFGFLPGSAGFSGPLSAEDGAPSTQAGSHPYQLTTDIGFPTENPGGGLTNAGHPHDLFVELPRGLIGNPAASPVLCTEAQLIVELQASKGGCPAASQIGTVSVLTLSPGPALFTSRLYNMVPPPGAPAALGFDAARVGIFVHLLASVRSDGDFGVTVGTEDLLALGNNPIFNVQTQVWGDPSASSHDLVRDECIEIVRSCPVEPRQTAFLTMPGECPGAPAITAARVDSWEEPGIFAHASYGSADLGGNPVGVEGCNALDFAPQVEARPTTNLADSPTGLDFHLHQPQEPDLGGLYPAALRDATIEFPAGLAVNASSGDGLGACSEAQIGFQPSGGEIHFSNAPATCPDAARLGSVEVSSPLLVRRDEDHRLELDGAGDPVPEPLHGSIYLAEPFANPFGSLIAVYLTVEDPKTGIFAKLAGEVEPDPLTGQLRTRFEENPELPLEDVDVHLFGGPRAGLQTPPVCGEYATTARLTPWSAPEGEDALLEDSFQTSASPTGGACPSEQGAAPHAPAFGAGMLAPQAGAYSPFVLKLSREDGSQRLAKVDTLLPPGLSGKLAGLATCSDAQLASAQARERPEAGALEQASPSCPASSELGTLDVAAGAGPTPLHVGGHAYLAGPYKGAPLSLAAITPALAGPFDLGAVLVRVALHVDPATAQIHAVSDPLPAILHGIPVDVRSIALKTDRPRFTLNPTSCDPMQIVGSALSALGQSAALANPFQVGGCSQLPFKPKLVIRLKGGTRRADHPKLIATLKAKEGEANIAKAQVKLPRSAFLDQAHIRTVCTRVQFAADQCPKGSIYGKAIAKTPLLDEPLTGPVYLRSSNHKLPDLIVALKGPDSLPIEIELAGKTDSVKGALRNTFEGVPDAPVSSFRLELFGGKRGLVINSRNLCAQDYRAEVKLDAQSGKIHDTEPSVRSDCSRKRKHRRTTG